MLSRAASDARLRRARSNASTRSRYTENIPPVQSQDTRRNALHAASLAYSTASMNEKSYSKQHGAARLTAQRSNLGRQPTRNQLRSVHQEPSFRSHGQSTVSRQESVISKAPSYVSSRASLASPITKTVPKLDGFGQETGIFIPERRHFLGSDSEAVQLASSYKRSSKSRSSLTSRKPGSITTRSSDAGLGGPDGSPGLEVRNPGVKGLPKSMSFLRGGVDYMPPSVRDEYQRTGSPEARTSYLHAKPSFVLTERLPTDEKAFRKTMRVRSNRNSSSSYQQTRQEVTNLRHRKSFSEKARDVSVSLKYRIKRLISKIEGAPPTFPPQQAQATRPHFRDLAGVSLSQAYDDVPDVRSLAPQKAFANHLERTPRSRTSSLRSRSSQSIGGTQSRITSWTNSISIDSTAPSRLMTEAERKRLSIIRENGIHVPSSSAGSHLRNATRRPSGRRNSVFRQPIHETSPGEVSISHSRLASALVREIDRAAPHMEMLEDDGTALRRHLDQFERPLSYIPDDDTSRHVSNETVVNKPSKSDQDQKQRRPLPDLPSDSPDPTKDAAFYRRALYRKASQDMDPGPIIAPSTDASNSGLRASVPSYVLETGVTPAKPSSFSRGSVPSIRLNQRSDGSGKQDPSLKASNKRLTAPAVIDFATQQGDNPPTTPGSIYSRTTRGGTPPMQKSMAAVLQRDCSDRALQRLAEIGEEQTAPTSTCHSGPRPSVEVEQDVLTALVKEIQGLTPIKARATEQGSRRSVRRENEHSAMQSKRHHREPAEIDSYILPNVTESTRALMGRVPSRKSSKGWELRDMARRASWRLKGAKSMVALRKENIRGSDPPTHVALPNSIMTRERGVSPSIASQDMMRKDSSASLRSVRSFREVPITGLARQAYGDGLGSYVASAHRRSVKDLAKDPPSLSPEAKISGYSGLGSRRSIDLERSQTVKASHRHGNGPQPVNENLTFGRSNSLLKPSKVLAQEHVRKMQAMSTQLREDAEHRLSTFRAPLAPLQNESTPRGGAARSETAQSVYADHLSPAATNREQEVYSQGLIEDYNCSASDLGLYDRAQMGSRASVGRDGLGSLVKSGLAMGSSTTVGTLGKGGNLSPGKRMAEEFLSSRRGRGARTGFA